MSKNDRKLGAISLILVAVLVFTALFNVAYVGNIASAGVQPEATSSPINTFEKTDLNFDSIREQYINQELVQRNIASYDGDRWVIVELEGDTLYDKFTASSRYNDFASYSASVEGQKAQSVIKAEHTAFLKKLDRHGIDYQIRYAYTAITNAVAVKVNAEGYNAIRKMTGVVDAYYAEYYDVPKVAVENNANVYTTGIYKTEGIEEAGEGMVVAILDTGLDYTHEAFQNMPKDDDKLKLTKTKIRDIVSNGNSNISDGAKLMAQGTADDFFYNTKVPFAYDYADDDANVYPSYSSHGTHVAGIVAGKSDYVVSGEDAETKETFVGVAPEAQLVICKVFTDNLDSKVLGGANSMGILAALNDCAVLGVDVINMSLGSSAGFSTERGDDAETVFMNKVYGNIEALGISLVVAASNDYSSGFGGGNGTNLASNPDSGTVGSPSTYSSALSVASINGRRSSYLVANDDENKVAFITNSSNEFSQEFDFIEQLYQIAEKNRGGVIIPRGTTLRFKYVPVGGSGESADYTTISRLFSQRGEYDGVIALIKRGSTTFADKVKEAMRNKADACIIYNNVAGTIRMSLGDIEDPIPACSISMDAGKVFVDSVNRTAQYGIVSINSNYLAGPFMSEFSSWGPTPSLDLKPEITAHGGEIISAVASGYDKLSGTSMAAPNMAGAIALLRQNLQAKHPELQGKELNSLVNQMLMSTATIAKNEDNNPYSPRKQGAGLAGIADAINAEGYITVLDKNNKEKDKTKIELYDDPNKNGVYTLDFTVHNITSSIQSYNPVTYVMTETMSSDGKTVAEKAYMLNDKCSIQYYIGENAGSLAPYSGSTIVVNANSTLAVRVVITLGNEARRYLDTNFANGMYVEGFVSLQSTAGTKITLGVPYLAFYGRWTDAPLFDYDVYEIAEDEQNEEDEYKRIKATASATMVAGLYYEDKYILPLGTYIYTQDEDDVEIYPDREKIAISMFDDKAGRTLYELNMVYAGLLRGASEMDVVITDDATGEIIYQDKLYNVRKAYAGGGAGRGAPIMIELNPGEWGLENNATYSVSVVGKLDYEGGENPKRASFEFPFTVDYEAPELLGYKIRYMPYTENRVVKYRIYMDVEVRDNQFVSALLPCYVKSRPTGLGDTEDVLTLLTEYPIPVTSQRGESTTVSFEITDYYEEYVKTGLLRLEVEDYALNSSNYRIIIGDSGIGVAPGTDAMSDPESVEFVEDEHLVKGQMSVDSLGTEYYNYTLTLAPYTLYTFNAVTKPDNIALKSLNWEYSGTNAKANGNELFTGAGGRATLRLTNTTTVSSAKKIYAIVNVLITGDAPTRMPVLESIQLGAVLNGSDNIMSLKPVGGQTPELELNPNQTIKLNWSWTPWYCEEPTLQWTSGKPSVVSVTQDGTITTYTKGIAYIEATAVDKPSVTVKFKVTVGRDYRISNFTLYNFYGKGDITVPSNLNIMYLSEDCFKGRTDIERVVLPDSLTEIPENAFRGCTKLKEVVIPGQCTTIHENAFAGCTSLEKVTLGLFVDSERNELGPDFAGTLTIGRNAFGGCVSLNEITNQKRITTIYERAFEGCTSLKSIDLSNVRVVANGGFKGCTSLATVITSENTVFGYGMFEGCTSLVSLTGENSFKASVIPDALFSGCTKLAQITFENPVTSIGSNAFRGTKITNITLPDGNVTIKANAFVNSSLETLTLSQDTKLIFDRNTPFTNCTSFNAYALANNNSNYYSVQDGALLNKEKTELIAVPYAQTSFIMYSGVTSIADGALSGVNVNTISLGQVTNIGKYAFAGNTTITEVQLPSGLTEIPEGLFDGCSNLITVTANDNFASVLKIGAYAFRNCTKLNTFSAENVTEIGAYAFDTSGLTAVPGANIQKIGASAFAHSKIVNANLPQTTEVGANAFANISTLTTVVLGGVKMGEDVFAGSDAITSVAFGEGTLEIGDGAFSSDNRVTTALTVNLPSTVKTIGAFAFYNRAGLTEINLTNVEYIDMFAFACAVATDGVGGGLTSVNLSNVKQIGYGAFVNQKLVTVDLTSAQIVGDSAFYNNSSLTSVTFGDLRRIGEYVFYNTKLTTVTLPKVFGRTESGEDATEKRTYTYEWVTRDEKGDIEDEKARQELVYTPGAFSGVPDLTAILVEEGNSTFFSVDGVLYSRVANGYVLEQYPASKKGGEYTVIDNTVIIGDSAFEHVGLLKKVILPYTVKTIGSYAFFNSSVTSYVFNSVEAPTLLASYISENDVSSTYLKQIFSREIGGFTNFYANFYGFAIDADSTLWEDMADDFELTMTIPRNARGYNGIWDLFFSTVNYTEQNMPDDTSHKAIEAINKLVPYATQIRSLQYDDIKTDSEIGKLSAAARVAYNKVVLADQIELMAEYNDILMSFESALRSRKAELGHAVRIKELRVSKRPDKFRYHVGEAFDPTGMEITAIYEDGSEVALESGNYSIEPAIIAKDTQIIVISYCDEATGETVRYEFPINNLDYSEEPTPTPESPNKGLTPGAIVGIVVGVVLGVGAIVGAVVAVLLLKKKGKKSGADKSASETKSESATDTAESVTTESETAESGLAENEPEAQGEQPGETEANEETSGEADAGNADSESSTDNKDDVTDGVTTDIDAENDIHSDDVM